MLHITPSYAYLPFLLQYKRGSCSISYRPTGRCCPRGTCIRWLGLWLVAIRSHCVHRLWVRRLWIAPLLLRAIRWAIRGGLGLELHQWAIQPQGLLAVLVYAMSLSVLCRLEGNQQHRHSQMSFIAPREYCKIIVFWNGWILQMSCVQNHVWHGDLSSWTLHFKSLMERLPFTACIPVGIPYPHDGTLP